MYKILFFSFLALLSSCATSDKMSQNQTEEGHYRLYTYPQKQPPFKQGRFKRLVIVSSNDFDGNIMPSFYPVKNRFNEKRTIEIGGIAAMRAYLDIFQKKFPEQVNYVDAGSFLNPQKNHEKTIFLYNYLNPTAVGLGLNEFLLTNAYNEKNYLNFIQKLSKKTKFPILNSNITYLLSQEQLQDNGIHSSYITETNGLKIGHISALAQDVMQKIPDNNIVGLHVESPAKNIITHANALRRKGADVIVLMLSGGIDCTSMQAHELGLAQEKVNFNPQDAMYCHGDGNELFKTLNLLPPKMIDLVISSGHKSKVANFINDIPVIQTPGEGKFLGWAEIFYDTKHKVIASEKTKIHQPVQLCHQFFKDTLDCYTNENFDYQELIPALFLGEKVHIKNLP
ncbi:MAG: hypothetical protein QF441_00825 [Bacteriovoracaceae bacterium]|jgi:2',3'-cyclic-nucleotide 2'-phosphodiesterase (5'-nucleotidase family)|nr:hypothetical protein [Bacteriovoracaceae bacterium]